MAGSAIFLSLVVHATVVAVAFAAGRAFSDRSNRDKGVVITLRDIPAPAPPPPPSVPAPEPPPVKEVEPKPEPVEPPPPKEPKKRPKKPKPVEAEAPPPPDPVDVPDRPPPDTPPKKPAYRVVGVNLESTVTGGGGPSFAVGNTRMGRTAREATAPSEVEPIARTKDEPLRPGRTNRAATRIPTVGADLKKPKRLKAVEPVYPEAYRAQGIEGNVVVRVVIATTGRVSRVDIAKSSGYPEFDAAAEKAARLETFAPAEENGRPIEYTITFTYRFRLNR